jgi:regulator of protease activity HflC (stomatin/prohibitin superfamily)
MEIEEEEGEDQLKFFKKIFRFGFIIVVLIFILVIALSSFFIIDAGERAIVLTFGNPTGTTYGAGLHFKIPIIQNVVIMSVRTQTVMFDNKQGLGNQSEYSSLFAGSSDLQDVQISTVVNYHINENDVLDIYKKYGDMNTYQKNIIEPIIRDAVKTISATYTAENLMKQRTQFSDDVAKLIAQRMSEKSAIFERVNIVNFQFSQSFTASIEKKVVAEQDALAQKNKLEQVKYEAEQKITQATAEATSIKIQSEALKSNKDILALRWIERWNGITPTVVAGDNVGSFIDLGRFASQ